MACGTPVIASTASSLPEVVGDAGVLVEPHDVDGLSMAMERILASSTLQQEMSLAGEERAKGFTWFESARLTVQCYRRVLSGQKEAAHV
jgi:glycosyltransferase involved in cell wall biosynthesis